MKKNRKVVITTGGTGGHIFPAQHLAEKLLAEGISVVFLGGGLKSNRYFKQEKFCFNQVSASTFFKKNIFLSLWKIAKGTLQSLKYLIFHKPDLVIGFGSFYSFPVLLAAKIKKIPYILFEPNAFPGKVNQFFSKWAQASAIQFLEAKKKLKGSCIEVEMTYADKKRASKEEARDYFYLMKDRLTFLVFGGSQGANSINDLFSKAVVGLKLPKQAIQILHIAGKVEDVERIRRWYEEQKIHACVKAFEEKMDIAWSAADVVVCRAGASTVAEQIAFEVPAIFIPFPRATDDHQTHNALFVEKEIKGAITCKEAELNVPLLSHLLNDFVLEESLHQMRTEIAAFKTKSKKKELKELVLSFLNKEPL